MRSGQAGEPRAARKRKPSGSKRAQAWSTSPVRLFRGITGMWHWGCSYLLDPSGPRSTSHCLIRLDTLLGTVRSSASDLTAAVIRTCLRPVGRGRSMHQRPRGNLTRRLSGAGTIVFRSTTTWGRRGRRTDHQRIQTVKPEVTLEVGFGCGISTLFVCDALVANDTECKHIVLDPYQRTIFRKALYRCFR